MKILFLGPRTSPTARWLKRSREDVVTARNGRISPAKVKRIAPDIIVSHNYKYLLSGEILSYPRLGAVNLHISYLPWNRGADPNVWSHIEGTRKGVTIHYIDKGVDSGDIIARKRVRFGKGHTLRSSYDRLQDEIVKLFVANWPMIRNGRCRRARQDPRKGTIHYDRDRGKFLPLIEKKGWDTSIEELSKAREGK